MCFLWLMISENLKWIKLPTPFWGFGLLLYVVKPFWSLCLCNVTVGKTCWIQFCHDEFTVFTVNIYDASEMHAMLGDFQVFLASILAYNGGLDALLYWTVLFPEWSRCFIWMYLGRRILPSFNSCFFVWFFACSREHLQPVHFLNPSWWNSTAEWPGKLRTQRCCGWWVQSWLSSSSSSLSLPFFSSRGESVFPLSHQSFDTLALILN